MAIDYVEETINSGIQPIEIEYFPIKSTKNNQTNGLRSVLKINSVRLGILYPEQYRVVSNRNTLCIRLAKRALSQLETDIPLLIEKDILPPFITVYIPTKMLMNGQLESYLSIMKKRGFNYFDKICIEFSSDLLLEETQEVKKNIDSLVNEYSLKTALSEYGDKFCPVLRISSIPLDFVFLDKTVHSKDNLLSSEIKTVISLISNEGASVCIESTDDSEIIDAAYSVDCAYYVGTKSISISEVAE